MTKIIKKITLDKLGNIQKVYYSDEKPNEDFAYLANFNFNKNLKEMKISIFSKNCKSIAVITKEEILNFNTKFFNLHLMQEKLKQLPKNSTVFKKILKSIFLFCCLTGRYK